MATAVRTVPRDTPCQIRGGQATPGQPPAQVRQQMHVAGDRVQGVPLSRKVLAQTIGERSEPGLRLGLHRPGGRPRPPWVVAFIEHHTGPHGLPRPHVHNSALANLTTAAKSTLTWLQRQVTADDSGRLRSWRPCT